MIMMMSIQLYDDVCDDYELLYYLKVEYVLSAVRVAVICRQA